MNPLENLSFHIFYTSMTHFNVWKMRGILYAKKLLFVEQLGPWATTTEPARLEPVLRNKRGHDSERPVHRNEEWPPLAATRGSPSTETKTQHSNQSINQSINKSLKKKKASWNIAKKKKIAIILKLYS